jgi:hypothetical protein
VLNHAETAGDAGAERSLPLEISAADSYGQCNIR